MTAAATAAARAAATMLFKTRAKAAIAVRQTSSLAISPEDRTDAHAAEIIALLKVLKNDFLIRYPASVQKELARHVRLEEFDSHECIFKQGTTGDKLYVVATGRVSLTKTIAAVVPAVAAHVPVWAQAAGAARNSKLSNESSGAVPVEGSAIVADISEGGSFGLLALQMGTEKRATTATAAELNTTLLTIDKETFTAGIYLPT